MCRMREYLIHLDGYAELVVRTLPAYDIRPVQAALLFHVVIHGADILRYEVMYAEAR